MKYLPYLKTFLIGALLISTGAGVNAQSIYTQIAHLSGSQPISNKYVTTTAIGNASTSTWCGLSPYLIGQVNGVNNGYEYLFSPPAGGVRFEMGASGFGEVIYFIVNGTQYSISSSNLSHYQGGCNEGFGAVASGGALTFANSSSNSGTTVDISGNITTIRVTEVGANGGTVYSFYLRNDTLVKLKPMTDSAFCAGDTVYVPFETMSLFRTSNVFSVQLSDQYGSFASPQVIGTLTSTTSVLGGNIRCIIPNTITTGIDYRLRIVSSSPVRISDTSDKYITLGLVKPPKPVAGSNSPICTNNILNLTANNTYPNINWKWNGPDTFVSYQQNPQLVHPAVSKSGTYVVTAMYYGCVAKDTIIVLIKQGLPPTSITTKDTICALDTLKLKVSPAISWASYSWAGPNGFVSGAMDTSLLGVSTSATGNYRVIVTSPDGCFDTGWARVFVKAGPNTIAGNTGPYCIGDTISLNATGFTANATYSWTGPGGFSSNSIYPLLLNANIGMGGDYVLKGIFNGCTALNTTKVVVNPVPATPTATNNNPVCVGGDIKLFASIPGNATYEWGGPNVYYSNKQNPVKQNAVITDGGLYTVVASVDGCPSLPGSTQVVITQGPEVIVYANPGDTICPNWDVSFVALPKNAGVNPTYEWYKNGVNTGASGANHKTGNVVTGDTFYVRMTAGGVCNTPINSKPVGMTVLPVHAPPTITVAADPGTNVWPYVQVKFRAKTGDAGPHPGYQWRRNGNDISGAKDSIWTSTELKTGDTICCMVTSNYLCAVPREVLSNCMIMNVDLHVANTGLNVAPAIYPNPNNGRFTLNVKEDCILFISDVRGLQVGRYKLNAGENHIQLEQTLGSGIYFGSINYAEGIKRIKINVLR